MSHIEGKAEHLEHGLDPGGGLWERLDSSRREIVQLCGEKGIALFSFLLESSTIMPGRDDIALFELQSLHDLAGQLGWSPDTVKRYVAVFRAVNLVQHHHDHRQEVKLHLPLGHYVPLTHFTALDELIGKRTKQRQLALKVRTRYIVRFGDPTQAHSDVLRTKFQKLNAILDGEHLEPLKRQRLQMQIADLFTQLIGTAKYPFVGDLNHVLDDREVLPKEGDSNAVQSIVCHSKTSKQTKKATDQGDLEGSQGDRLGQSLVSSSLNTQQQGDPKQAQGDREQTSASPLMHQSKQQGDLEEQQGDRIPSSIINTRASFSTQKTEQGDLNERQGDLLLTSQAQKSFNIDKLGDSKQNIQLEQGDLNRQAATNIDVKAPYTYNVTFIINNITENNVIRKQIAQFLANVFEKNEFENGYPTFAKYLKAFKDYTPEVIGRAFLTTIVLLHHKHWRVDSPGAAFTNQCKVLSGQKPLAHYTLEEVEEWMHMWGQLPYAQLIEAVAAPSPEQQVVEPAGLIAASLHSSSRSIRGNASPNSSIKNKRTYGMAYTGRPVLVNVNKGINNLDGPMRPPEKG